MFVDFNTFVDLKVVVLRIKTSNKFKTFGPNNGMSRPVYIDIGQTTVYRFLERQALEGSVIKIQPVDGSGTQYWRLPCPQADLRGKLVCLKCRKVIPLSCEHLDMFSEHVLHKHKFNLSLQHSILYGYCEDCDN